MPSHPIPATPCRSLPRSSSVLETWPCPKRPSHSRAPRPICRCKTSMAQRGSAVEELIFSSFFFSLVDLIGMAKELQKSHEVPQNFMKFPYLTGRKLRFAWPVRVKAWFQPTPAVGKLVLPPEWLAAMPGTLSHPGATGASRPVANFSRYLYRIYRWRHAVHWKILVAFQNVGTAHQGLSYLSSQNHQFFIILSIPLAGCLPKPPLLAS